MSKLIFLLVGIIFIAASADEKLDTHISEQCGTRNFIAPVVETTTSYFGEFPWMVLVLREEQPKGFNGTVPIYHCGASLIHPQVVLTAAHCVADTNKTYGIRAGEWDTQSKAEPLPHQERIVKTVIIHQNYKPSVLFSDIALLILDSPLNITGNINTICLPDQDEIIKSDKCYVSGWGTTSGKDKYSEILKRIEIPLMERGICQERLRTTRLGKLFELDGSFICAGGEGEQDTCKGDGGSPLVCPIPGYSDRYMQVGITAWGIGCGKEKIPGVYADVAQFKDWIEEQLEAHEIRTYYHTY